MTSLSDESRTAVDEYLRKLEEKLAELPDDERADAVAETRSHIEEAVARIREDEAAAVGTVLRSLGDPGAFAEGLLSGDAQEEPAAEAQPVPVTPAQAPERRRFPVGWCVAGCIAVPVVLGIALAGLYFWAYSARSESMVKERALIELQKKQDAQEAALRALEDELLHALTRRDAERMMSLLHPDLVAERDISGGDLLLPEGADDPEIWEIKMRGAEQMQLAVRADGVALYYLFERHVGDWRIRDFGPSPPSDPGENRGASPPGPDATP